MKIKRKRYVAQFLNTETNEIKPFDLFSYDDCENGTSGRGIALKTANELAVEHGLVFWWLRVIPVMVTYSWTREKGCTCEKITPIRENETAE